MKFLVDAQLPRRLAHRLRDRGHDALHTLDLERGNRTPDRQLSALADQDGLVLVTKDADFVNSHVLAGRPAKLLLISTGNLDTGALERLLFGSLADIVTAFATASFVELTRTSLVVHGR